MIFMNRNERGALLVSSYLVLVVLGVFSVALYSREITTLHSYHRSQNLIRAFHLAESGVDLAISQLRQNSSYAGQGYSSLGNAGGYLVQVQVPDPVASPNVRRITATGETPSNLTTSYAYQQRQVVAYVNISGSPFNNALFAKTSIDMNGNAITDSYDSRTGVMGTNGDIATNGAAAGAITLTGNARVKGDAVVGPGADVSKAISLDKNTVIEGTQSAASSTVALNSVQIPPNLANQGALSVSSKDTVTLPGGAYWYSSINISGDALVNFTGPATLYVSGSISITGKGIVTSQNLPPNLLIYVQGSPTVSLAGKDNFYGAVYAPDSNVSLSGNAALYGAVVGAVIHDSGKALVRYDEALKTINGNSSNTVSVLAWTEA